MKRSIGIMDQLSDAQAEIRRMRPVVRDAIAWANRKRKFDAVMWDGKACEREAPRIALQIADTRLLNSCARAEKAKK